MENKLIDHGMCENAAVMYFEDLDFESTVNHDTPESILIKKEDKKQFDRSFSCLNDRHEFVIKNRIGCEGNKRTLKSIGIDLGIGAARVGQLEAKSIRKIRSYMGKITG